MSCPSPEQVFWSSHYLRHTRRRQAHLASLGLDLSSKRVLEVGAGIGDHTEFFLERDCSVISTEPRGENLVLLRNRYPGLDVRSLDLNQPPAESIDVDVVYCYGTLYHLESPAEAITWMSSCARELLLLETCLHPGEEPELHTFDDPPGPEYAVNRRGCRPTRSWVRRELSRGFPHVYSTITQPLHEEFPLDWSGLELEREPLLRAVFVASRGPLNCRALTRSIPTRHIRH
jgi:hypothetical protein